MEILFGCLLGILISVIILCIVTGNREQDTIVIKESYFDGSIVVTHTWHRNKGQGNDEILFEFLSPAPTSYHVEFTNPNDPDDDKFLPEEFFVYLNHDAPQKRLISHPEITKYLGITISEHGINGANETHYF